MFIIKMNTVSTAATAGSREYHGHNSPHEATIDPLASHKSSVSLLIEANFSQKEHLFLTSHAFLIWQDALSKGGSGRHRGSCFNSRCRWSRCGSCVWRRLSQQGKGRQIGFPSGTNFNPLGHVPYVFAGSDLATLVDAIKGTLTCSDQGADADSNREAHYIACSNIFSKRFPDSFSHCCTPSRWLHISYENVLASGILLARRNY